jgi:uncharacterized membrane protein YfcA
MASPYLRFVHPSTSSIDPIESIEMVRWHPDDVIVATTGAELSAVAAIGVVIGFLGGLLGKGGSALATPMLHAIGLPAIVAVAAPLPATIPSTMAAGAAYARERLVDWRVVRWTVAAGVPATIAGAIASRWVGGGALVAVTDVVLVGVGLRVLRGGDHERAPAGPPSAAALVSVAVVVGLASGLLANSGGFLLAPLFVTVLRLPIKRALATSLAVATVLAVPGTVVHAWLGHIDWTIVLVFGLTAVPLSVAGAKVALRTDPRRLERVYGAALVLLGAVFLLAR